MKTLVAKEIRLVLPAFVAALALAMLPIWLVPYDPQDYYRQPVLWPGYLFLFGAMLLALTAFGREIGLNTFPFILSQPLERGRIWWTKIVVLTICLGVVFDVWLISENIRPWVTLRPAELGMVGISTFVFAAGAIWLTLLLRQLVAAFWLALLLPIVLLTGIYAFGGSNGVALAGLGLYGMAGFFLARRQFFRLQDTAWTGGAIVLGGSCASLERSNLRGRRPWAALFWNEVRLQQVTLLGMFILLVLHLGVVALRKAGANTFSRTTLMVLDAFGALWFVVPLLAGSQSVAEERKFGTMQAHSCLPISRRARWFLKLAVSLLIGGLLSWLLLVGVDHIAGDKLTDHDYLQLAWSFLLLALAGFYGSTMTGGLLQALAAAVLTLSGLFGSLVLPFLPWQDASFVPFSGTLPIFVGGPLLLATVLALGYRNFGMVTESWRVWWRNALALAGMAALSIVLTVAIYHRAWEWLTPLEPPPGPARLSLEKPPILHSSGGSGLAALFPDGRLRVDHLDRSPKWLFHNMALGLFWQNRGGAERVPGEWESQGSAAFVPGSNWVDAAANDHETAAIRSDGTLWVSEQPRRTAEEEVLQNAEPAAGLIQFAQETNWLRVVCRGGMAMLLLKRDGTLWAWGTNVYETKHEYPSLRRFAPRLLGRDSDWARMIGSRWWIGAFLWKTDGSGWILHYPRTDLGTNLIEKELAPGIFAWHLPGLDNARWRSLVNLDYHSFAGVRDDGTLWYFAGYPEHWPQPWSPKAAPANGWIPVQIGKASDWAELANTTRIVGRKMDGSLWLWEAKNWWEAFKVLGQPPVRLGINRDWIALGAVDGEITSVAADGILWDWPDSRTPVDLFYGLRLAASRKPTRIENILGAHE